MTREALSVTGMSCGGCEDAVETSLRDIAGVKSVTADNEAETVVVETDGSVDTATLKAAVDEAGYEVVSA